MVREELLAFLLQVFELGFQLGEGVLERHGGVDRFKEAGARGSGQCYRSRYFLTAMQEIFVANRFRGEPKHEQSSKDGSLGRSGLSSFVSTLESFGRMVSGPTQKQEMTLLSKAGVDGN